MSSILEELMGQLQGGGLSALSQQLGADEGQVSKAAMGALPALLGGLANNSASSSGAGALAQALDRDHDGSVLDDVAGFLGGGGAQDGGAIVDHVLGGKKSSVESALGGASGLDGAAVTKMLAMLAPLVMGALGKQQRQQGLDASGLGSLLGQERETAYRKAPEAMGMLGQLLDRDNDGSMVDDITEMGSDLLSGFLSGKR